MDPNAVTLTDYYVLVTDDLKKVWYYCVICELFKLQIYRSSKVLCRSSYRERQHTIRLGDFWFFLIIQIFVITPRIVVNYWRNFSLDWCTINSVQQMLFFAMQPVFKRIVFLLPIRIEILKLVVRWNAYFFKY